LTLRGVGVDLAELRRLWATPTGKNNSQKEVQTMANLNKWHYVDGIYTRDTWTIPAEGTEIWATWWEKRGQTIKPTDNSPNCCHVLVGFSVYHCDELMGILLKRAEEYRGTWGIEGVTMTREQKIGGYWRKVEVTA